MTFCFFPVNVKPQRQFKSGDKVLTVFLRKKKPKYILLNSAAEEVFCGTKMQLANYLSEHKFEPFNFTNHLGDKK